MSQAQSISLPLELRSVLAGLASAEVSDDQHWILELMREQGPALATMLWRMLGSEQDVLDAYQTAVCRLAAQGREAMRQNPAGYFYRTAMNAGIEMLRMRRQQRRHWPAIADTRWRHEEDRAAASVGGEKVFDQRQAMEQLRRAIAGLPPHLRHVIVLRDLAELPYRRVAALLGITPGTARLYRRQAVVRLADLISQEEAT